MSGSGACYSTHKGSVSELWQRKYRLLQQCDFLAIAAESVATGDLGSLHHHVGSIGQLREVDVAVLSLLDVLDHRKAVVSVLQHRHYPDLVRGPLSKASEAQLGQYTF